MRWKVSFSLLLPALFVVPSWALPTPISTINGYYGQYSYDTPELTISNNTAFDFTNVQLKLTGYQGINNGVVNTASIPNVAAGTTLTYNWGSNPSAGILFSGDYDDTGGNGAAGNPACVQPYPYCAFVGNFYVTFTAQWNGQSIYSQFSPDPNNPSGVGNAAGVFVGWEGLDPNGLAETVYDDHNTGGPNGVLANIYVGTPPPINPTPEPSSLMLLGTGAAGVAGALRRRFRKS